MSADRLLEELEADLGTPPSCDHDEGRCGALATRVGLSALDRMREVRSGHTGPSQAELLFSCEDHSTDLLAGGRAL